MAKSRFATVFLEWIAAIAISFAAFGFGAVQAAEITKGHVTITRDSWGVPHIEGKTEEDGFYGLGWAEAEDQLGALLSEFLATEGRAASVYGTGKTAWGAPAILSDWDAIEWQHAAQAKAAIAQLPVGVRRQQEAYAAGIRGYMKAHPEKVPAWAPNVQPWHPLALARRILWFFDVDDGLRACASGGVHPTQPQLPETIHASNAWVISGKRTADGRTVVLSDPHGDIDGGPFYEFVMHAGDIDAGGYAFGSSLLLAHTPNVAWGLTTGGPAVSDCYRLPLDKDGSYRVFGKKKRFAVEHAAIAVKGSAPIDATFEYADIAGTPAPVIYKSLTDAYVVATPYFARAGEMHVQTDRMIHAKTTGEVLEADSVLGLFPQNLVVGDRYGSIAYLRAGRTPIRNPDENWQLPLAGDDPRTKWRGFHPYTDLVMVKDPADGFIQNDNYPPLLLKEVAEHKPAYPSDIINNLASEQTVGRGDRITELLQATPLPTLEQEKAFALDETWIGTDRWTKLLAGAASLKPDQVGKMSAEDRAVLDRLLKFDGRASGGSVAALNSIYWRSALWDSLDDEGQKALVSAVSAGTAPSDALAGKILSAVSIAVIRMNSDLGRSDLPYGAVFRIGRDGKDWPLGGGVSVEDNIIATCFTKPTTARLCVQTLRAFAFTDLSHDKRMATDGSRALRLVELGNPIGNYSIHNYGQSEDPNSPHHNDQAEKLESPAKLKEVKFDLKPGDSGVESTETLSWTRP